MFPVRIWTRSRWFLLENENLFPDRFGGCKDGGEGSECFCFELAKDICVLVIFLWNRGDVDFFGDSSRFGLYCGTELDSKYF